VGNIKESNEMRDIARKKGKKKIRDNERRKRTKVGRESIYT
jgi:hypothetical protein